MTNVHDLHLQEEILPLFDRVCNEYSRKVLWSLLTEIPETLEEVTLRQGILKGFIKNDQLPDTFSYGKAEFSEVHAYTLGIKDRMMNGSGGSWRLHLLLSKADRHWERARFSQLFIFLDKIRAAYVAPLRTDVFPAVFEDRLSHMRRVLSDLEVERYRALVRKKGLGIGDIIHCMRRVWQKCDSGELDQFWKELFLFEAYFSIARGIKKNQFTFPEFDDHRFELAHFYHPLLKDPVKNSLEVGHSVTLITGPNMSGKSTLLKSIGLCVYLAHLGLAVPAEKCMLPFFDVISVAIHLNDDIKSGYSHFMMEVLTLKNVVVQAHNRRKCFALFDELFRGTSVDDALVISGKTITGLTKFEGSFFFISTHLHGLKESVLDSGDKVGTHYIECSVEKDRPVFTYKLLQGWSDVRIGQVIFENEGLNELLGPFPGPASGLQR
jgi:DNA mismatch repair protein MutS